MSVIKVEVAFEVGETVFHRVDPEQEPFFLTGYIVTTKEVMYDCANKNGQMTCFEFELSREKSY